MDAEGNTTLNQQEHTAYRNEMKAKAAQRKKANLAKQAKLKLESRKKKEEKKAG